MHDSQIVVRIPAELVARLDALVPALEADPAVHVFGKVTRSTVVRLAVAAGLGALEARHVKPAEVA